MAWDPPVDPPGAPVTTYRLQVSKNATSGFFNLKGAEALKAKDICSAGECTYTHVDLFENTEQFYRVYASNCGRREPGVRNPRRQDGRGGYPDCATKLAGSFEHRRPDGAVLGPASWDDD